MKYKFLIVLVVAIFLFVLIKLPIRKWLSDSGERQEKEEEEAEEREKLGISETETQIKSNYDKYPFLNPTTFDAFKPPSGYSRGAGNEAAIKQFIELTAKALTSSFGLAINPITLKPTGAVLPEAQREILSNWLKRCNYKSTVAFYAKVYKAKTGRVLGADIKKYFSEKQYLSLLDEIVKKSTFIKI